MVEPIHLPSHSSPQKTGPFDLFYFNGEYKHIFSTCHVQAPTNIVLYPYSNGN